MTGAKTILMDEPAGSLNPVLARKIFSHIVRLGRQMEMTFLAVEHRLDVVAQFANYAYAMADGGVIARGAPKEVLSSQVVVESYIGRKSLKAGTAKR
jgi:branched-chain amino acid transport system ATP-binding protein